MQLPAKFIFALLLFFLFNRSLHSEDVSKIIFHEDFDKKPLGNHWIDPDLKVVPLSSVELDKHVIKHSYVPTENGSPYVGKRFKLNESVNEATLTFDMKLDENFEFVRGGKIHGLAGGKATAGCRPIEPDGWSARMMWRVEGKPVLYVYHQDRKSRCGDDIEGTTDFYFEKGVWYRIAIYVKMNTAKNSKDGVVALFIDGIKRAERKNLNLVSKIRKNNIDYFLYSSFYGGSDPSWKPSKTTFAYYDDFNVCACLARF